MSGNNKGNNHADLPDWLNDDDKPSKPKKPQANKPKSEDELAWLNDPALGGEDGDDLDWLGGLGADDPLASLGGDEDDEDWLTAGADEEPIANDEDNLPAWLQSAKPKPAASQPLSSFDEDNLDLLLGGAKLEEESDLFGEEEEPAALDPNAPIEANTELPAWLASAKIVETKPEPTPQIDVSALASLFGDEDEPVTDWLSEAEPAAEPEQLFIQATPAAEPEPEMDWLSDGAELGDDWLTAGLEPAAEPEQLFTQVTPPAEPEPEMDWLSGGAELGDDWLTAGLEPAAEPEQLFTQATPAAEPEPEIDWLSGSAELGDDWLTAGLEPAAEPEPLFTQATPAAEPEPEMDWLSDGAELGGDDWLTAGLEPATEPEQLFTQATPAAEPEPEIDWFSGGAEPTALDDNWLTTTPEPATAEGGLPDWLSETETISADALDTGHALPETDSLFTAAGVAETTEGLPDWLAENPQLPSAEFLEESNLGSDWLISTPAAPEPDNWLSAPLTPEEESTELTEGLPDWLASSTEEVRAEEVQKPETAWLQKEVVESEPEPVELEWPTTGSIDPAEVEASLPDWLVDNTETELVTMATPAVEEVPDWLMPPVEESPAEAEAPALDKAELAELPDWLAGSSLSSDELDTEPTAADEGFFGTGLGLEPEEADSLGELVEPEIEPEELADLDRLDTLEPTPAGDEEAEFAGFFDREQPVLDSLTSEEDELDGFFGTGLGLEPEETDSLGELVELEIEPTELAELDQLDTLEPTPAGDEEAEFAGFFDREQPILDSLTSEEDELDGFFGTGLGLEPEEASSLGELVEPEIEATPAGDEEAEFAGFFDHEQPELSSLLGSDESLDELFPAASTPSDTEMGFEDLLALDSSAPADEEDTEPLLHPDETVLDSLFTSTETTAFAPVSEDQLAGFFDDLAETPLATPASEPVLDELFASAELPAAEPEVSPTEPEITPEPVQPEPPMAQTPPAPAEEEKKPKRVRGGGAGMFGGKDVEEVTISAEDIAKAALSDTKVSGLDIPDDEEAMMAWLLGGMSDSKPAAQPPLTPVVEAKTPEPTPEIKPEPVQPEPPVAQTAPAPAEEEKKPKRVRGGGAGMFGSKDEEEITVSAEDLAKAALSDTKVSGLDIPDDEEAMMAWLLGGMSDSKPAVQPPVTPVVEAKTPEPAPEIKPEPIKPEPAVAQTPPAQAEEEKKPKRVRGGGAPLPKATPEEEITVSAEDLAKAALSDTKVSGLDIPDDEEAMMAWLLGGMSDSKPAAKTEPAALPAEQPTAEEPASETDLESLLAGALQEETASPGTPEVEPAAAELPTDTNSLEDLLAGALAEEPQPTSLAPLEDEAEGETESYAELDATLDMLAQLALESLNTPAEPRLEWLDDSKAQSGTVTDEPPTVDWGETKPTADLVTPSLPLANNEASELVDERLDWLDNTSQLPDSLEPIIPAEPEVVEAVAEPVLPEVKQPEPPVVETKVEPIAKQPEVKQPEPPAASEKPRRQRGAPLPSPTPEEEITVSAADLAKAAQLDTKVDGLDIPDDEEAMMAWLLGSLGDSSTKPATAKAEPEVKPAETPKVEAKIEPVVKQPEVTKVEPIAKQPEVKKPEPIAKQPEPPAASDKPKRQRGAPSAPVTPEEEITVSAADLAKAAQLDTKVDGLDIPDDEEAMMAWLLGGIDDKTTSSSTSHKTQPSESHVTQPAGEVDIEDLPDLPADPDEQFLVFEQLAAQEAEAGRPGQLPPEAEDLNELDNLPFVEDESLDLDLDTAAQSPGDDLFPDMGMGDGDLSWLSGLGGNDTDDAVNSLIDATLSGDFDALPEDNEEQTTTDELLAIPVEEEIRDPDMDTVDQLLSNDVSESLPDWLSMEPMGASDIDPLDWLDTGSETGVLGWLAAEEETSKTVGQQRPAVTPPTTPPVTPKTPPPSTPSIYDTPKPSFVVDDEEPKEEKFVSVNYDPNLFKAARSMIKVGDIEGALETYQEYFGQQSPKVMIKELESVLQNNNHPLLRRLLGDAYMQDGQLQKALDAYSTARDML